MTVNEAYNRWAKKYDVMDNKTRDLEKIAAKKTLNKYSFETVVEFGCGTGKNTIWLSEKAKLLIAIDFSEEMLAIAKEKIKALNVEFIRADITKNWCLQNDLADLIICGLILEHVENLDFIFKEAHKKLNAGGKFYICELHPFKQYTGSKARFESENGIEELEVYVHHISEFINSAAANGLKLVEINEWFDEENRNELPRLISFIFEK